MVLTSEQESNRKTVEKGNESDTLQMRIHSDTSPLYCPVLHMLSRVYGMEGRGEESSLLLPTSQAYETTTLTIRPNRKHFTDEVQHAASQV